jgi:hypothetical protein
MSKTESSAGKVPDINLDGFHERILLEAELITREGELRNFSAIRDRLTSYGKDANAAYRECIARRDTVAAKLRAMPAPPPALTKNVAPHRDLSLLELPIAPANFRNPIVNGLPGFGYSGFVQAGPLSEGVNVVPGGRYVTGDIHTASIGAPTYVDFNGAPSVGPEELPPDQYDPTIRYFWLHNWQVLVPFPAPTGQSRLTYQFNVGVTFEIFNGGIGTLMSFVSVGETANLTGPVTVNADAGWPLIADLSQPNSTYNGFYGSLSGQTSVQRTFAVGAGHVPAVAIVVGAVVGLPMQSEVQLSFGYNSSLGIYGSPAYRGDYVGGKIAYHVTPELVVYEP